MQRQCPARAPAQPNAAPLRVTITLIDTLTGEVAISSSPDLRTLLDIHQHGPHATSALLYALAAWVGIDALCIQRGGLPCTRDSRLADYAAQLLSRRITPTQHTS